MRDLRKLSNKLGFVIIAYFVIQIICKMAVVTTSEVVGSAEKGITLTDSVIRVFCGILIPYIIFFNIGKKQKVSEVISFAKPKNHVVFCVVVGLGFAILGGALANLITFLLENLGISSKVSEMAMFFENTPGGIALYLFNIAVVPAFVEEFLFRGIFLGSLNPFGKNFAVFASALIFGLIHGNMQQFVSAFILGLIMGFLVTKTGSIWSAIILHFINNLLAGINIIITENTGSEFFPYVIEGIIMLVVIIWLVYMIFKDKEFLKIHRDEKTEDGLTFGKKVRVFILNPGMFLTIMFCLISFVSGAVITTGRPEQN